ncbi:MAG: hypothetical protein AB7T06_26225 [Kofleriaceae bacterium]
MGTTFEGPFGATHFDPRLIRWRKLVGHHDYEKRVEGQYRAIYPALTVEHAPALEVPVNGKLVYIQPDLLLCLPHGEVLLVAECKCKNKLTAKDVKQAARYRRILSPKAVVIYHPSRCRVSKKVAALARKRSVQLATFD